MAGSVAAEQVERRAEAAEREARETLRRLDEAGLEIAEATRQVVIERARSHRAAMENSRLQRLVLLSRTVRKAFRRPSGTAAAILVALAQKTRSKHRARYVGIYRLERLEFSWWAGGPYMAGLKDAPSSRLMPLLSGTYLSDVFARQPGKRVLRGGREIPPVHGHEVGFFGTHDALPDVILRL